MNDETTAAVEAVVDGDDTQADIITDEVTAQVEEIIGQVPDAIEVDPWAVPVPATPVADFEVEGQVVEVGQPVEGNELALVGYNDGDLTLGAPMLEAVVGMDAAVRVTAELEVTNFIDETGERFTATEIEAMTVVQELSGIAIVDLAVVLMKAERVKRIQSENIVTRHPGDYASLAELAQDNGLSNSELSNILDLVDTIFPYLRELGYSIGVLWRSLGKSKFREMTPILKVLISGEAAAHGTVNASVEHVLDSVAASAIASGDEMDAAGMRVEAVRWLVDQTELLTIPQMRREVRPVTTPIIHCSAINVGEDRIVMMRVSDEQWLLVNRILGRHFEAQTVALPEEPVLRRERGLGITELRDLLRELGI